MLKKINVAVIGTGNMGRNHVRVYSEMKNCKLIAICDIDFDTMNKISQEFHCKGYLDYKEMLEKEKIDAVSIAVPTKSHKEIAVYCLNKNINTFLEKPIAYTTQEANEILKVANQSKGKFTVGHIERFNPAVLQLDKLVKKGRLGKILSINAKRLGPYIPKKRDTGVILDIAVHDIDIINFLMNRLPKEIYANGGNLINNYLDDYADIFLKYDDFSAYVQVNWISPLKIRELSVTGTKGFAKLNYITQDLEFYKRSEKKIVANKTAEPVIVKIKKQEPLKFELEYFISMISKGKKNMMTGKEARDALDITIKALNKI
ncbi:MAG TPA: Gfo/Idh/MocA family oxidoreductase [Candidatus Pacearchaeota archaeon]|nr:Gfo/Idh/MocA family oxidoreductase [Candidatus Parcubacteria bacterium]HNZ83835.1 Gfo/Idh/MocA family oxidoreductase [Candidatus Pacearchaeota archaeon]